MTVVITLSTGEKKLLDRSLSTNKVAEIINEGRGKDELISFQNNATPSRTIWIDPNSVTAIENDGFTY